MSQAHRWPRMRTHYHLHRTKTGRLSSGMDTTEDEKTGGKVAQVHNIPKIKKPGDLDVRWMFRADPGYRMISGDWAAIQWALCMWFASGLAGSGGLHEELLRRHQEGSLDPHRYLAGFMAGHDGDESKVTKQERQLAKGITYGRMFKGHARVLAYETKMPQGQVEAACEAYEQAFKLAEWWDSVEQQVLEQRYVESPDGWRRYFFEPFRRNKDGELASPKLQEVLASLIQASEAGVLKYALVQVFQDQPDWVEILTTTHDSVLIQVPEAKVAEGCEWLKSKMEVRVPWFERGWKADVQSGEDWSQVA